MDIGIIKVNEIKFEDGTILNNVNLINYHHSISLLVIEKQHHINHIKEHIEKNKNSFIKDSKGYFLYINIKSEYKKGEMMYYNIDIFFKSFEKLPIYLKHN